MKLFSVEIVSQSYVIAESDDDAARVARKYRRDIQSDGDAAVSVRETDTVSSEWFGCAPFSDVRPPDPRVDWTVEEWMDAIFGTDDAVEER